MWIGINLHYNIYNIQGALFFRNQKYISLCNLLEENICNYHLYGTEHNNCICSSKRHDYLKYNSKGNISSKILGNHEEDESTFL